ncbi:MAG: DDE-type integrase/transposase/recombinase [Cyclobacteriaceae bacterium]|nr:DDE-type integrase/transposase/recombinase [Cyclobacteriaceae bacterium]
MYYKLTPQHKGRDAFERFCKAEGLMSKRAKNWHRTTDSSGVIRFDTHLINLEIREINQVWQSDITYYEVNSTFYYITFVEDAFSRKILGYQVSKRLTTEKTTLPALRMAIKQREKEGVNLEGLIFHSDGGGQYYDKEFLHLTGKKELIYSMCEYAWENGKVERLNGVIKNNYLRHRNINSFKELQKEVDRSVLLYNLEKPHIKLQRKSPIEFEKYYIANGQQIDGDKSATELKSQPKGINSPLGCGQQTSGSNIAPEYKSDEAKKK